MQSTIQAYDEIFPVLPTILNEVPETHFAGLNITIVAHLTSITAHLVSHLHRLSGIWNIVEANPRTTNPEVVTFLNAFPNVLVTSSAEEHSEDLLLDVGGEAICTRQRQQRFPQAAIEITQSGINRLQHQEFNFGILNINDSPIKALVERRYGVGEGLWKAFSNITALNIAGRKLSIFGYGPVGQGVADYAKALGAQVSIVELNPMRQLHAHYHGFSVVDKKRALKNSDIIVTATGSGRVLQPSDLDSLNHNIFLCNVAHNGNEFPVPSNTTPIHPQWQRYRNPKGSAVHILGAGAPLNIVCNAGSAEPVLLQFALCAHSLCWLAENAIPTGLQTVPEQLVNDIAAIAINTLHPELSDDT